MNLFEIPEAMIADDSGKSITDLFLVLLYFFVLPVYF